MFDPYRNIGPINVVSVLIFLAHAALGVVGYNAVSAVRVPASVGGMILPWITFSYPMLISMTPVVLIVCFSFLFVFAGTGGPANAKAFGLAAAIGAVYTFFAYVIQAESPEPFFAPAMMLLPILYGIIYLVSFFSIWLAE